MKENIFSLLYNFEAFPCFRFAGVAVLITQVDNIRRLLCNLWGTGLSFQGFHRLVCPHLPGDSWDVQVLLFRAFTGLFVPICPATHGMYKYSFSGLSPAYLSPFVRRLMGCTSTPFQGFHRFICPHLLGETLLNFKRLPLATCSAAGSSRCPTTAWRCFHASRYPPLCSSSGSSP